MNADVTAILSVKIRSVEKRDCKQIVNIQKKFGKKSVLIDVIVKENDKTPAKLNSKKNLYSINITVTVRKYCIMRYLTMIKK